MIKKTVVMILLMGICCLGNFLVPQEVEAAAVPVISGSVQASPVVLHLHRKDVTTQTPSETPPYSEDDLYVMSHVICGEAGSEWISDEEQLLVGNVVMNRVASPDFPDTIREVVFEPGQYACTWDGNFYREPDARTVENAKRILNGERFCPDTVVYQSNEKQGEVYTQIGQTYFCYG